MTTPSVRIGLIGIGNIGSAHLRWMLEHPESGLSVAALCDIDPQKRELLRRLSLRMDERLGRSAGGRGTI